MGAHYESEMTPRQDARRFWRAFGITSAFVVLLWWIKFLEWTFGQDLHALGVRPGNLWGLVGVLTGPVVHGSLKHVVSNSLPILVIGTLSLYSFPKATWRAFPLMWIAGGLGTWFFGRESFHFGASGVAHGLMFFVFLMGVLRWERRAMAAAMVTFFLYGGMLLTVLPREEGISWEYHLFGALGGALAALLWRNLDPRPPVKRYDWEDEPLDARTVEEQDMWEMPRPRDVPVLWHRPAQEEERKVLPFRPRQDIEDEPPTTSRH